MKTDALLQQGVMNELKWWSSWVPHDRIKVMVQDGRVTLSGEVDRYSEKQSAEDAVRHFVGVWGVTNSITVKPPKPIVEALKVKKARSS